MTQRLLNNKKGYYLQTIVEDGKTVRCARNAVYIREYVQQWRMFGHNINEEDDGSVHLGVSYPRFLHKNNNISDINKILSGLQVSRC